MANRPTGVTILAILLILGAILNLYSLLGAMIYGILYFVYVGVFAIVGFIVGISLWGMQPWARKAAIILELINLIASFVITAFFFMIFPLFGMIMLVAMMPAIIIALIVVLYLMQSSVKAAFEGPVRS